jgi:acetyl-CoA acyltransferase 1
MNRVGRIVTHICPEPTAANDDDIVICAAYRTPITKAKKGGFKDTTPDAMLAAILKATVEKSGVDASKLGDVVVGNVLQGGAGALTSRMAGFLAGLPEDVPLNAVNRQCSSGLQAVANVASAIKAGYYDIGMAAGVESMTTNSMMDSVPADMNPAVFENDKAQECLIPMGQTSENVARKFGITREQQDKLAVLSHQKAVQAQKNGWFDAEIVPVTTIFTDKDGEEKEITVSKDDGVRPNTSMESLAKMRPAFDEDGTTTAGNASQVSDGAAAVLVASRAAAKKEGLPIIGTFKAFSVVGCPPDIMGIGPAVAIPAVLKQAGKTVADVDIFEINEAFASQATYCVEKLNIPLEKVNPKGGAIAFGHPLGATGARQVSTLIHELKRTGKKSGIISMCIGTGMGAAAYIEAE